MFLDFLPDFSTDSGAILAQAYLYDNGKEAVMQE